MAYTDTPDPIIATITNSGRNAMARAALGDISLKLVKFAVGRDGYVETNPVHVLALDPSLGTLIDQVYPTVGQTAITGFEFPYPYTLVVNCKVYPNDFSSGIGELGVWAEIINSNIPSEIGTQFLFSVAHMGLITKTFRQSLLFRVIIQF